MSRSPLGPSVITFALAAIFVVGCGAEGSEAASPSTPATVSPAPTEITSSPAPRSLRREDVRRTVRAGLGAFLQRIQLDENPVFESGHFKGFRIAALTGDPTFWNGVDLRPGDVVLRVNGKPIERPEQALAVFAGLETAPELRVSIERGGNPRELVFPIEESR
jgi:type II secretory pathway component PulC